MRFNQAEDGQIQLIAIPQVKEKKEEVEREGEEEEEEVGPLAMSQPIVRLDLLKASAGFSEGKEEIIVEDQSMFWRERERERKCGKRIGSGFCLMSN